METWRNKFNKKYGNEKNKSNSLKEISKKTGVSMKGLRAIYNKGIGAFKTNPSSVRKNVSSKEQWAMGRVYSAVMGGKAKKIDAKELKFQEGGEVCTYDFDGYAMRVEQCSNKGVDYLLTGEYTLVSRSMFKERYDIWNYYNYINRIQLTLDDCIKFKDQMLKYVFPNLEIPIGVIKANTRRTKRSVAKYVLALNNSKYNYSNIIEPTPIKIKLNDIERNVVVGVWTELVCCGDSWGAYFLDKNTNRPLPALDPNNYYSFTTLIHELAHCLDFILQLEQGIRPVVAHKKLFLRSLYNILDACKNGKIPIAELFDKRAYGLQKIMATKMGKENYFIEKPKKKIRSIIG